MTCDVCRKESDFWRDWGNGVVCWYCSHRKLVMPATGWKALVIDSGHEWQDIVTVAGWEHDDFDGWKALLLDGVGLSPADYMFTAAVFHESERPSDEQLKAVAAERRQYRDTVIKETIEEQRRQEAARAEKQAKLRVADK